MTHNERAIMAKEILDFAILHPDFGAEFRKPNRFKATATATMVHGGVNVISMTDLMALTDTELEALQKKLNVAKAAKAANEKHQKFKNFGSGYYPRRTKL